MSLRDIEVRLGANIEDAVLSRLGYREYSVTIGSTPITVLPEVNHKNITSYTQDQLSGFADRLGGNGNPISIFELKLSRVIPESTVRQFGYWILSRDGYEATCLPIDIKVEDSRYIVLLGVIKQTDIS